VELADGTAQVGHDLSGLCDVPEMFIRYRKVQEKSLVRLERISEVSGRTSLAGRRQAATQSSDDQIIEVNVNKT